MIKANRYVCYMRSYKGHSKLVDTLLSDSIENAFDKMKIKHVDKYKNKNTREFYVATRDGDYATCGKVIRPIKRHTPRT